MRAPSRMRMEASLEPGAGLDAAAHARAAALAATPKRRRATVRGWTNSSSSRRRHTHLLHRQHCRPQCQMHCSVSERVM